MIETSAVVPTSPRVTVGEATEKIAAHVVAIQLEAAGLLRWLGLLLAATSAPPPDERELPRSARPPAPPPNAGTAPDQMLSFIRRCPEMCASRKELLEAFAGWSSDKVGTAVFKLREMGWLEQVGRGRYRVVVHGEADGAGECNA